MKQIVCGICNDFRALHPKGSVSCRCGNVTGWWVDPQRGIAKVKAKYKGDVRILGMHNSFLQFAFSDEMLRTSEWDRHKAWREMHELVTSKEISGGYLFQNIRRACPFVLICVGESSDVTWANDDEQPPKGVSHGSEGKEEEGGREGD